MSRNAWTHRVAFAVALSGLLAAAAAWAAPPALAQELPPSLPLNPLVDSGQRLGQESSYAVALADLDGDGDLDAFIGNKAGQPDQVWRNDGRGAFADTRQPLGTAATEAVALGDLNGDGAPDAFIVTGDKQPDTVWFNDGQGNLADSGQALGAASGRSLALADFDRDGDLDALVANGQRADAGSSPAPGVYDADQLYLNRGDGTFDLAPQSLSRGNSQGVAVADFDQDTNLDLLVVAGARSRTFPSRLSYGDGQGNFPDGSNLSDPTPAAGVAVADFNADGWPDAFVANGSATLRGPNTLWTNDGAGMLDAPRPFGADDNQATGVAAGDVTGDGRPDLYVTTGPQPADQLWIGNGAGGFDLAPVPAPPNGNRAAVALGDLNGDGALDAFIANASDQANLVLLNSQPLQFIHSSQPITLTAGSDGSLADLDGDGDLDAATTGSSRGDTRIWCNQGHGDFVSASVPLTRTTGQALALGDLNGDRRIDLYLGGVSGGGVGRGDQVWLNQGGCDAFADSGQRIRTANAQAVALGDLNADGALDAFIANGTQDAANQVLLNDGQGAFTELVNPLRATDGLISAPQPFPRADSRGVALGDVDTDGDLDAVVAVATGAFTSTVWFNNGDGSFDPIPLFLPVTNPQDVALGDLNGDGALDAFFATYDGQPNRVYFNDGRGNLLDSQQSLGAASSMSVALADLDGDGDLDAVTGDQRDPLTGGGASVWWNNGDGRFRAGDSLAVANAVAVALGDLDGDGAADVLAVPNPSAGDAVLDRDDPALSTVWLNRSARTPQLQLTVATPGLTPAVRLGASAERLDRLAIPVSYTLSGPLAAGVKQLDLFYSLDGGGQWLPAVTVGGEQPVIGADGITTSGVITWNTAASNLFGASDNAVLRLAARFRHPTAVQVTDGMTATVARTYRYTDAVAGPVTWPELAATTTPFRVRGLQVRVVDEAGNPVPGAVVMRRPAAGATLATLMADPAGWGFTTDANGYLRGRDALVPGDELVALAPITDTFAYRLFHLSAPPTNNGLRFDTVPRPTADSSGVQTLTVAAANPLLLFDLDISLEWDASNDGDFLQRLAAALRNASEVLFDVTNGQAALGEVTVFQAKENWANSHIVIYAANNIHPRATMGGVILEPISDISGTQVLTDAYVPGQIRMGVVWDPFGQNQTELQQDWWRAFAHELGHYLLFLPDNYIGVRDGLLTATNCQGSLMTSAYDEDRYGEFLTRDQWQGDCLDTVAYQLLTGRTDWETITRYLPMLAAPAAVASGPSRLPIDVTAVTVVPPLLVTSTVGSVIPARPFDLRDENGNLTSLRQATAYLYQFGNASAPVSGLVALGSTGSGRDNVVVRGARPLDRVCVFDAQHTPPRAGCTTARGQNPTVDLRPVLDWSPQIEVTPITSTTLAITVTQAVTETGGDAIRAQVFPAYGPNGPGASTVVTLTQTTDDPSVWSGTAQLAAPSFEGYVRVWQGRGVMPVMYPREAITQYFLNLGYVPGVSSAGVITDVWVPLVDLLAPITGVVAAADMAPVNMRAGGGVNMRAGGGVNMRAGGGVNMRAGGGVNMRAGGGVNMRAGGGVNMRAGGGVNMRAGGGVNMRAGGGVDQRAWGANQRTLEAPVASGDGRLTIFNLSDPLAIEGALSLQALDTLPSFPAWLSPVGKGYRFTAPVAEGSAYTRTVAFHYSQRDVPEGYEYALSVYFLPAGATAWQALPTRIDTTDNLASAQMPTPAAGGSDGVYALVATVPLAPLQPGWNFLAYSVPETRTVAAALDSLGDNYTAVYGYDPNASPPWVFYDAGLARTAPNVAAQVNTLQQLDFGRSYLIYATASITPYLAVPGPRAPASAPAEAASSAGKAGDAAPAGTPYLPAPGLGGPSLAVAPATLYGFVTGELADGQDVEVIATIGGIECGRAPLTQIDGRRFYTVQVAAAAQLPGCGTDGAPIDLAVAGQPAGRAPWRNTQATEMDLAVK